MKSDGINTARSLGRHAQEWRDHPRELLTSRHFNGRIRSLIQQLRPLGTGVERIHVGPAGDGGYLLPDDLLGVEACFSPGVDTQISVDLEIANRGLRVHLANASLAEPTDLARSVSFAPKATGLINDQQAITLDKWVNQAGENGAHDMTSPINIESVEHGVLASTTSSPPQRFRNIIIEFHFFEQLRCHGLSMDPNQSSKRCWLPCLGAYPSTHLVRFFLNEPILKSPA